MNKLHIFIDGSWLFRVCQKNDILSKNTECSENNFPLSFEKLNASLFKHAQNYDAVKECSELGNRHYATCIFDLTPQSDDGSDTLFKKIQNNVIARNNLALKAFKADYQDNVYRPVMNSNMEQRFKAYKFKEKQVDATIVALLVRSAILQPTDYHVLVTGDADIEAAIKVLHPEYSQNIILAIAHPDELKEEHRHTAFSYNTLNLPIPPYYLQDHIRDIIEGEHVYACSECAKVFVRKVPIPSKSRPYCKHCHLTRT